MLRSVRPGHIADSSYAYMFRRRETDNETHRHADVELELLKIAPAPPDRYMAFKTNRSGPKSHEPAVPHGVDAYRSS